MFYARLLVSVGSVCDVTETGRPSATAENEKHTQTAPWIYDPSSGTEFSAMHIKNTSTIKNHHLANELSLETWFRMIRLSVGHSDAAERGFGQNFSFRPSPRSALELSSGPSPQE